MPGCQRIPQPQRRHVELVANSETGNTGLKKGPGLHALHNLCATVRCAPLEIVVPQECPCRKKFLAPPLSVAYVTNNKRLCLTFCTIEANY